MTMQSTLGGSMKSSFSARALGMIMAFLPAVAVAEWNLNFTPVVTLLGEEIQAIHNLVTVSYTHLRAHET
mgnify:CR=1 FL=1